MAIAGRHGSGTAEARGPGAPGRGPVQPFLHLAGQARRRPAALAMVGAARRFTFGELFEYSRRIASVLRQRGVAAGDTVVTQLDRDLDLLFLEALFHEATIGCTFPGIVDVLHPVGFDWLIASRTSPQFPEERTIIIDQAFMHAVAACTDLSPPRSYPGTDSVCRLVFSSGTTGLSRAVPFTVAMLEGRCDLADDKRELHPFMSLVSIASILGTISAYTSVRSGETYLCPGDAADNLKVIRQNFVAGIEASPTQLAELVHETQATGARLDDLGLVVSVGGHLPSALMAELRRVSGASVLNTYGSTEAGLITTRRMDDDDASDVGTPCPHAELQIVDERDAELPPGAVGTIRCRKDFQAQGYYPTFEASEAFRDGWFYPGDLGMVTTEGRLVVKGRSVELINAGGVKLNPAAVDAALAAVPGIVDVAVFGATTPTGVVAVAIALVAPAELDLADLIDAATVACQGTRPACIVRVDEIPRNSLGKVRRAELAASLRETVDEELARTVLGETPPRSGAERDVP